MSKILDSGERQQFETGAVRDIQKGKGRCDLAPLDAAGYLLADDVLNELGNFQDTGDKGHLVLAFEGFCEKFKIRKETAILEATKQFEGGAEKYGIDNWKKGIPVSRYLDSMTRHYLKFSRGDTDEPHDRAFVWNVICAIWTTEHKPELNDLPRKVESAVA